MNKISILLFGIVLSLSVRLGIACESQFNISREPESVYSPLDKLGIHLYLPIIDEVPFDVRQRILHAPGDYFRYPRGAKIVEIRKEEINTIGDNLSGFIKGDHYDSCTLNNIVGIQYTFKVDSITRSEYFLRYSKADTIYVISGWFDKFLSFYRAIPGSFKYKLAELNGKISEIAANKISIPKDIYNQSLKDSSYFIEYVDRDRMLRVRCYHISEQRKGQDNPLVTDPYTLIEITRFLDKEMVP